MKKLLILLAFNLLLMNLQAQQNSIKDVTIIKYYKWSDPTTFKIGTPPKIKGYGPLSDSLSNVMNGVIFYHINEDYYPIQSWADYYYRFTKKFPFIFHCPSEYEYYYFAEDDYGMANFIFGEKYLYDYYPSNTIVRFDDRPLDANKTKCSSKIKKFSKDQFYEDVKSYEQKKLKKNRKYKSKPHKRDKELNARLKTISTNQDKKIIRRPSNSFNKPDVSREYNKSNKKPQIKKNNNIER